MSRDPGRIRYHCRGPRLTRACTFRFNVLTFGQGTTLGHNGTISPRQDKIGTITDTRDEINAITPERANRPPTDCEPAPTWRTWEETILSYLRHTIEPKELTSLSILEPWPHTGVGQSCRGEQCQEQGDRPGWGPLASSRSRGGLLNSEHATLY